MSLLRKIRELPPSLLAIWLAFAVLPIWSLTFAAPDILNSPFALWTLFTIAVYWLGPIAICVLLLRRSFAMLIVFGLECLALMGHAVYDVGAGDSFMHVVRFVLLAGMAGVGTLLASRDVIFPFLQGGARGFRRSPRLDVHTNILILICTRKRESISAKTINISLSGLALEMTKDQILETTEGQVGSSVTLALPLDGQWRVLVGNVARIQPIDGNRNLVGVRVHNTDLMGEFVRSAITFSADKRGFFPRLEALWFRTSVRRTLLTLWSLTVAGAFGVPACGDLRDGEQVARVGDPIAASELVSVEVSLEAGFALSSPAAEISLYGSIENCISGFKSQVANIAEGFSLPVGDADCDLIIDQFEIGDEYYLLADGAEFDAAEGALNAFVSNSGREVSLVNIKSIANPVVKDQKLEFLVVSVEEGERVSVKADSGMGCTLAVETLGDTRTKPTTIALHINPTRLPTMKALVIYPCNDDRKECGSYSQSKDIKGSTLHSFQYEEIGPHKIFAEITWQLNGKLKKESCSVENVSIPPPAGGPAACSFGPTKVAQGSAALDLNFFNTTMSTFSSLRVFPCGTEKASTYSSARKNFSSGYSGYLERMEKYNICLKTDPKGANSKACGRLADQMNAARRNMKRAYLTASSYSACVPYEIAQIVAPRMELSTRVLYSTPRELTYRPLVIGITKATGAEVRCSAPAYKVKADLAPDLNLAFPWQHPILPSDVNLDDIVSLSDKTAIESYLGSDQKSSLPVGTKVPPPYYDVDGDGTVSRNGDAELVLEALTP